MSTPALTLAFEIRAEVTPPQHVGRGPDEVLEVYPIVGGTVTGPRLTGTVTGLGADWAVTRGTVTEVEARYLLQADDGALIDVVNRGVYRDDGAYFFTTPVFRTDAPAHRWLTETVFVGAARDDGGAIVITVYAVG
ncbi:MAG: hypothetical protein RL238_1770 [Actinomycetota bacterium]|jgi:hypothetical protein